MDMSLLSRPLELAALQYAVIYSLSIGYMQGVQIYLRMISRNFEPDMWMPWLLNYSALSR